MERDMEKDMEKAPDCDLTEESSLTLSQDIPSNGLGDLRCSDLDVPMFTSEILEKAVSMTLQDFTNEQWMLLMSGLIDSEMINSLSDLCYETVEAIIAIILECVEPQVLTMLKNRTTPEDACSSSSTHVAMERNYLRVTVDDIQASFGDSLHLCFGEAAGLEQERCQNSDILLEIFAEVVTKGVNSSLAQITGPESEDPAAEPQRCASSQSYIEDMVYHVAQILRGCKKRVLKSAEDQGSPESAATGGQGEKTVSEDVRDGGDIAEPEQAAHPEACPDNTDKCSGVEDTAEPASTTSERQPSDAATCLDNTRRCSGEQLNVEDAGDMDVVAASVSIACEEQKPDSAACPDNTGRCSDELWKVEDISDMDVVAESVRIVAEGQTSERSVNSVEEFPRQEKISLTVFLRELVEQIAHSTSTSILDVDLVGMVTRLTAKTVGDCGPTLPQTVGKMYITIFQQLCMEFGSAKRLRAAMTSSDGAFEEAVAKHLKAQLQKSTGRTRNLLKKIKNICKRSSKVHPARGARNMTAPHQNMGQEGETAAPPSRDQKKHPAIVRMFTAVVRCLKKPFTSCSNRRSQNR